MERNATASLTSVAQRYNTDRLDRGLVAVKTTAGVYCSWRINADEYYGTKYNLYRDGAKVNAEPLETSNYTDKSGSQSSTYTVKAVANGVEQSECKAVSVQAQNYKEITLHHDASLKATYIPNDACCADVDGDGEVEILMKFDNSEESSQLYPKAGPTINGAASGEYSLLEVFKLDGTLLWWVNCGPNMGDFQNNEQNIVGYDWDGDGKAEAVMRLCEGATIHMADGTTYTIGADGKNGTNWTNYRTPKGESSVEWFTYYGNEFLYYCEGATGKPYQCIEYPLKRLESGETSLNTAWGDGYGHRSNKHFFGAPYLDGQHPSIFIGRGIYTRHKFIAYDVDATTHELKVRWRWTNNQAGSPWYGQGYHNYTIADVDWDGRDEIVWGSMVIDDNGKGLSTTGLGHGDAHHVGDLNPYIHGQEGFFCNEDAPANNYRDLTTSKIYYRMTDTSDAGRALAGNFYNDIPGAIGNGAHDTPISTVTNDHVTVNTNGLGMNFRIYWDGDLQEECFDNVTVSKPGVGTLASLSGAYSNNSTKATPCYQGDIYGDWREEVIERTAANNIRIYTTTTETPWRNYSLWYDHQYRNAMVWQMCGYNQPPHASYFLGELEGITIAPPPLTTQGREVVGNNGTVGTELNGKHVLISEWADITATVADGAQPEIITVNAPSIVAGSAESECTTKETAITYGTYTTTLSGAPLSGSTMLVKQGDGILNMPANINTNTGETNIWAGTLLFDGTMQNSKVWLNRFAVLMSDGGNFNAGIKADYGSAIYPGGQKVGTITATTLDLGFGSRVVFNVDGTACSKIKANSISIEKKTWSNGPAYNAPVFEIAGTAAPGTYVLAEATEITGDINDIIVEGLTGKKFSLDYADGKITLTIADSRSAEDNVVWTGANGTAWDMMTTENFSSSDKKFVAGDAVVFDDTAEKTTVDVSTSLTPSSVTFANDTKTYTLQGDGSIEGDIPLYVNGMGTVNIKNTNTYSGGTYINGGTLVPSTLANVDGTQYGALGAADNSITITKQGTLKVSNAMTASHPIFIGQDGGTINCGADLILNGSVKKGNGTSRNLYKTGTGTLQLNCTADYDSLYINQGKVYDFQDAHFSGKTVVLNGSSVTLQASNSTGGSAETDNVNIVVPKGKSGIWYPDGRCNYTGKLTGEGTINIYSTFVRCAMKGDWSAFSGTINAKKGSKATYEPQFDFYSSKGMPNATLNVDAAFTSDIPFNTNGQSFSIGALTGSGYVNSGGNFGSSTNTLTIGTKNTDFTFSGTINGSYVVKKGTGVWTISAETVLANAKSLTVSEGAVKLNKAAATSVMTTSTINYVKDAGELRGNGLIYGLNLQNGGGLRPGTNAPASQTSNTGSISIQRNLVADAGSHIYINKAAADSITTNSKTGKVSESWAFIKVNGNVTINGTIHVTYKTGTAGWTPKEGDYIRVFDCNGTVTGAPTFDLQELPEGLMWDTSSLLTTGVIKVVSGSGITQMTADFRGNCAVYSTAGTEVAAFSDVTYAEAVARLRRQGLPRGTYLIRISNGKQTASQKVNL